MTHDRIPSLKYKRNTTFDCKDKGIKKPEFVAKTRFLIVYKNLIVYIVLYSKAVDPRVLQAVLVSAAQANLQLEKNQGVKINLFLILKNINFMFLAL